jgi:hypothetical protein
MFLTINFKLCCTIEKVQFFRFEFCLWYLNGVLVLVEYACSRSISATRFTKLYIVVDLLFLDIINFLIFRIIVDITRE